MSLSAATSRPKVVTRSPSNTSLNVGLPPPIPSSTYQTYTSPSSSRYHSRPNQPHRGDVSSTATSDDGESEDEGSREPGWVLPPTPARVHVPGALNGMESSRKIAVPGKRMTLQERLAATAAAAKMKKSDSNASVTLPKSSSTSTIVAKVKKSASSMSDLAIGGSKSGDKVVVCVRQVTSLYLRTCLHFSESNRRPRPSLPKPMKFRDQTTHSPSLMRTPTSSSAVASRAESRSTPTPLVGLSVRIVTDFQTPS